YRWNSSSAAQRGWLLGDVWGSVDEFSFSVYSPSGAGAVANLPNFFSTYLNQWVLVTGVYRPGQSVALYVNGIKVAEDTSNVPASIGLSNSFRIGARADNRLQANWDGQIDEVQLLAHALNPDEILALYQGQAVPASDQLSIQKYYFAGAQRIALRQDGALFFILADHQGSTDKILSAPGNGTLTEVGALDYLPWGEVETATGVLPTAYTFTGQRVDAADTGLMFYNARWYDPTLGRFLQADPLIPDPANPQSFDRYQYVYSNPVRYRDPSGHCISGAEDFDECMQWAAAIEEEWDFITVITCVGYAKVDGCVGWTAYEMELLYQTLSDYLLPDQIDDGQIYIGRTRELVYTNGTKAAGIHRGRTNADGQKRSEIWLSDAAWTVPPLAGIHDRADLFPNAANFQATIAHELTHAATWFHPENIPAMEQALHNLSPVQSFLLEKFVYYWYPFERVYDTSNPDRYQQRVLEEILALLVGGMLYDPWLGIH
ncbi:MAG: hypothetical protein JW862_10705, partial [Anaerolineales bacterium]|nr:hypothetical protein [Anaerolineales bacterium]